MTASSSPPFISNWVKYKTFLEKQDGFLADLFTHYQGRISKYEYERVLIGLLHRYALNFRTIYRCWGDFLNNPKFKFAIYTLLRPLIADQLLMIYLLEEFKWLIPIGRKDKRDEWEVNETGFIRRYKEVSTSFFTRLESYLKKKVKNSELSSAEMEELLSHQRNIYTEFSPEIKAKKAPSPGEMADRITYGREFKKSLYDHYFRLSQFEHFTIITEELMGDPDKDSELMDIIEITDRLLNGLNVNISTIRVSDEFRNKTVELINGFRSIKWER